MNFEQLKEGVRIYYGGDMANLESFRTITKQHNDRWGQFVSIKLDDGRTINKLPVIMFSADYKGHGGTRFVTIEAYNTFRHKQVEACGFEYKDAV